MVRGLALSDSRPDRVALTPTPLEPHGSWGKRKILSVVDDLEEFTRLFMFPGVEHCSGGAIPNTLDVPTPVMAGESGRAHSVAVASKTAAAQDPASVGAVRSTPTRRSRGMTATVAPTTLPSLAPTHLPRKPDPVTTGWVRSCIPRTTGLGARHRNETGLHP